jgi:signal transduction histidine kinase/HAMP domain-containing protein/predicted membrane protein
MVKIVLFNVTPYIDLPYHLLGWIGWFFMAAMLLWLLQKTRFDKQIKHFWLFFVLLILAAIGANAFLGFNLPWEKTLPLPNVPRDNSAPLLVFFASLPLVLAAGLLGTWPAVLVGLVAGVINALFNTHSVFTPLETAAIGYLMAAALRQDYRTLFFRFLRHPLGAAVLIALFSTPIYLVSTFFGTNGSLAARLDYSFTQSWILVVTNGIQLIIAGLLCEVFALQKSALWVQFKSFRPSPSESGLQARILTTTVPMVTILLITLSIADWAVAGQAARTMVKNQLQSAANAAAENIPYIQETGQSLLTDIVNSGIPLEKKDNANEFLKAKLRSAPFFKQLYLFDLTGAPITGYPLNATSQLVLSSEEEAGIKLALNGVSVQFYAISSAGTSKGVQLSFLAAIPDEYGLAKGVLLARTDMDENIFSQPAVQALDLVSLKGGQGLILDENNIVLYDSNAAQLLTTYNGSVPEGTSFFDEVSGTGTRQLIYKEPIGEKDWKVIVSLPASTAQELALKIAVPLLIVSVLFSVIAYFLLRYMMRTVTFSLVTLANQASRIAQGGLDTSISPKGVDEIGRLGSAFEQMRISLKERLDELDRLLEVSQGVASNLSIEGAADHILKAALSYGADSARLVLLIDPNQGIEGETEVYCAGPLSEEYQVMDQSLLDMMQEEKVLVIPSRARLKRMGMPKGASIPAEMLGTAIRDGSEYLGALWVGYAQPHRFSESEVRFFNTLSNQVILAVSNSKLYLKAESGKQRLESVLAATPDPVLLVNSDGQVLTGNQAAENIPGLISLTGETLFAEKSIGSQSLSSLLKKTNSKELSSNEIFLENGRTYLVSVSPVELDDKKTGKVCVLHDVSDYKELEKMKSDFVATVSHDLRTPLGQLKGYVSMLPMVGEMNAQQKEYGTKIMENLDKMAHMVDNLLDLGRIEAGIELQVEKVAPLDLLDQAINQVQPLATQRKIQLMRELTTVQDLQIDADKTLLLQALVNLLENAIKFSPLNGQVLLRLTSDDEMVKFEVQDHGPGISPIDLPTIFEKVQKSANKDGKKGKNVGLGLSIVKSIADRHHGKVTVESVLGKGSTFALNVPIRQISKNG